MFIYNVKVNGNRMLKIFLICVIVIILILFGIAAYTIFDKSVKVNDNINKPEISNLSVDNYTNILKSVCDNLEDYVGEKICFSGYVYRAMDFKDDEFVLARDMVVDSARSVFNRRIHV